MNKTKLFWLSLFFLGLFTTIPNMTIAQMECSTPDSPPPQNFTGTTGECSNLIDQDGSESFPIFTVKMAIHFIADGNGNFYDGDINDWNSLNGTTQSINLINHSNELLSDLHDNPIQSIDFDGDSRIRFEVVPNYEDGVYFWDDIADYVPVPGVLNVLFIDKFTPPSGFYLNGLACGIDSDCNNVKQWGWQSSELLNGPWHFWNYARLLNHEVFHVLGLNHAWYSWAECSGVDIDHTAEWNGGDKWNSGSTNTMNYVNCQCALSPCQWSHIYSNCYDNHFSFTEIDCNQPPIDIIVDQDQTWNERVVVTGNVIIQDGVTLTVTCDVELNTNSQFLVQPNAKLIVDGGTLTSLKQCNVSTWRGVRVYGGNSDFDIKFTNDAIIENTSEAAVSMFAPEPWPGITQFGNGILQADKTTFNNTKRIVEFMSWSPLPNPSYIRDCVQNGGKWSITNWNCQGIDIRDNVFNDITNECIVTETGSFTIVGNEFNSGQSDILFNSTSAGIASLIVSNQFNGANTGYNARGTAFAQNRIWNNNFQTGSIDVMNDGHNQFDLKDNNITATFGAATFDGGGGLADVRNNDFSGNLAGAIPIGSNPDYNFFENCYSTTFVDNHIVGQVSPLIHSGGSAANNCFTHGGNQNVGIQDIGGNPDPFTYLEPTDNPIDCQNAILAHPNVNRISSGPKSPIDCGSNLQGGDPTEWSYCWPNRKIKGDVWSSYLWLQNKLIEIDNDPNLSEQQKEVFKRMYKRCFWRVRGYLFEIYLEEGKYDDARALYTEETHEDAKVYVYSSYIMENDLTSARTYLNSILTESEQMSDFVIVQNINLDRLPYGPFYEASDTEINTVIEIAQKNHSYAAYAKALYYVLTGEVISSEIPDIGGLIQPRSISGNTDNDKKELKVYPNPFSEFLNVEVKGYENVDIAITDVYGRVVYSESTDQSVFNISIDTWNQGMYLIVIKSDNEVILIDKILLIH